MSDKPEHHPSGIDPEHAPDQHTPQPPPADGAPDHPTAQPDGIEQHFDESQDPPKP